MKTSENVLRSPWTGPFGGVPPWDGVEPEWFLPAFEAAIENGTMEIAKIADQTEPATFENTLVALESAGRELERVSAVFNVHASSLNLGPIPEIERKVEPMLSRYHDSIMQNRELFDRVDEILSGESYNDLTPAQKRLVEDWHRNFVRQGAKLNPGQKTRLSEINVQLAERFTQFSQNVMADEERVTVVADPEELDGLPESLLGSLEMTSDDIAPDEQVHADRRWVIPNTRSSMEPVLTYATNRELREKIWRTYYSRCDNGDENDNKEIIREILRLRAERAELLGYETHAHWRLETQMAKNPDNAMALMMEVWPKAIQRVAEEVSDMQAIADRENLERGTDSITIEPWDYRFYSEKVRAEKFDLDFNEVKPYLQLEKLREGMMWAATELFGLEFQQTDEVSVFHPDVQVWEVSRDGKHVGLWYFDPFARRGKRSGAWMSAYRKQEHINEPVSPIVSNNSNFMAGKPGEPVLLSWDDALTLFHEFGHALHGLCSQCQYPSQSGTSVARDYVEFPSQVYEHWLETSEILQRFAVHHETGQPLPVALIEKIKAAATFNQGFSTVEFLASALMDMKFHLAGNIDIDPSKFEQETLSALGMPSQIVMRHRTPHFSHVFSSDGYSAGYYSYLWADVLTADAAEAFEEAGSFFDEQTAKNLHDNVLSVGDTIDPADGFRRFRGRDVDSSALMRKRGFPTCG